MAKYSQSKLFKFGLLLVAVFFILQCTTDNEQPLSGSTQDPFIEAQNVRFATALTKETQATHLQVLVYEEGSIASEGATF